MRPLAMYAAVLAVTAGTAHAGWLEYGPGIDPRPAQQIDETRCDVSLEIHGAVVEGELRMRLENTGVGTLASALDLELPAGALATGLLVEHDRARADAGVAVPSPVTADHAPRNGSLGADPALLSQLPPADSGRPRVRLTVQPFGDDHALTLTVRWTAPAEIRDGALRVTLPGHSAGADRCHGLASVQPGPGARVERIRLDTTELAERNTATFETGALDATLIAQLAFKKAQPLVWTQTAKLGDGYSAQAITVLAPPVRTTAPRRALLVIDGSRSMELVGRHHVKQLVHQVASALPVGSEIEALVFDRTASRVLGAWRAPTADAVSAIETAVGEHAAANGSDTAAALAQAKSLLATSKLPGQIILITDGTLGSDAPDALANALGSSASTIDLSAIVLSPGQLTAPDAAAVRAAVDRVGGSYVELASNDVEGSLAMLDDALEPGWHDIKLTGAAIPLSPELHAGAGIVHFVVGKRAAKLELSGRGERPFRTTSATAPAAGFAPLALAAPGDGDESTRAKLRERFVSVDDAHAFAVLSAGTDVATNRRKMVAGGGPYTRIVAVDDAVPPPAARGAAPIVIGGSSIDRGTVTLLLRQYLQPFAFICYQKAIATNSDLAGTVTFKLEIGRGELVRATVAGLGNATFDACLLDAAYKVTPPLPNPDYNIDDRTIVNYPLTFSIHEQKPYVMPGDADSSSPIDIDAIQGGIPGAKGPIKAGDTSTPLGDLRPAPMK